MERSSSQSIDFRQNNFNVIRLIAAVLVMAGHMGPILGIPELVFAGVGLHTYGVEILFLIGGYLVASSWKHDPHPLRYGLRRFLRLWPPYAFMILLMTFVTGPFLSNLGGAGYFESWWSLYLKNLRFYIVYAQPGVFTENTIPFVVNGSLWTMPVEAVLYLLTPLLLCIGSIRKIRGGSRWFGWILFLLLVALGTWLDGSGASWIYYATDWAAALKLGVFFFLGMLFTREEFRRILHLEWCPVVLLIALLVQYEARTIVYSVMEIALPYLVFSFAFAPNARFSRFGTRRELSYGIYLYGFFFQQLVAFWQRNSGIQTGMLGSLAISLIPTIAMAWISCVLIEEPCRKLCKRILRTTQRS